MPRGALLAMMGRKEAAAPVPTDALWGWWDATDLALSDGAPVETWANKGSGLDLNATGAAPTFVASDEALGMPGVDFNRSLSQFLAQGSGPRFRNVTGGHIFAVASNRTTPTSYNALLIDVDRNAAGSSRFSLYANLGDGRYRATLRRLDADSLAARLGPDPFPSVPSLVEARQDWSTGNLTMKVDGATVYNDISTSAGATSDTDSATMRLGANHSSGAGGQFWDGRIYEVLAYDRALDAAETAQVEEYLTSKWLGGGTKTLAETILELNPVGYWKLDEASGTTAVDYSGNGRDGTYIGAHTLQGRDGVVSLSGGYVEIPQNPAFSLNQYPDSQMTIFMLAYVTNTARCYFFSKGAPSSYEWEIGQLISSRQFYSATRERTGPVINQETADQHPLNQWVGVSASLSGISGTVMPVYRNSGTPLTATHSDQAYSYIARVVATQIGARGGLDSIIGAVGHAAIFPGRLTDQQIGDIMAAASAEGWF